MGLFVVRGYATTAWLRGSDVSRVPRMHMRCRPGDVACLGGTANQVGGLALLLSARELDRGLFGSTNCSSPTRTLSSPCVTGSRRRGPRTRLTAPTVRDVTVLRIYGCGAPSPTDHAAPPAGGATRTAGFEPGRSSRRVGLRSRRRCLLQTRHQDVVAELLPAFLGVVNCDDRPPLGQRTGGVEHHRQFRRHSRHHHVTIYPKLSRMPPSIQHYKVRLRRSRRLPYRIARRLPRLLLLALAFGLLVFAYSARH